MGTKRLFRFTVKVPWMPVGPGVSIDLHVKILNAHVVQRAKTRGLDGVVYAPHFTPLPEIQRRAREFSDDELFVLPAREIFTGNWKNRKHLLALNLTDPIPDFIRLEDTMSELGRQDAIILVPHPRYATVSLSRADIEEYQKMIHGIEVYNLKYFWFHCSRAKEIAESLDLPEFGSSYAHLRGSVGEVSTYFPECVAEEEAVLSAIRQGARRVVQKNSGSLHSGRRITEIGHLCYENTIQKLHYTFLERRETTPDNPVYGGRFDAASVYAE